MRMHDSEHLSRLGKVRWRLPILACGEGCTFAVGRTAFNPAAHLKLTRAWSCLCLLQLSPVQYTEVHWLVLEAQPTEASRFEKYSLSWCTVVGARKNRWGQGRGKDTLRSSKLVDCWVIWWLMLLGFACGLEGWSLFTVFMVSAGIWAEPDAQACSLQKGECLMRGFMP